MTPRCEPLGTLAEAAALPPGDPRRDHVETCARCRARLLGLKAFLTEGAVPVGADPEDAELRLDETLATATGTQGSRGHRDRTGLGLLAMAAVLLLVVVVPGLWPDGDGLEVGRSLRGEASADALAPTATVSADGILLLSWTAVPDADGYTVAFFDESLNRADEHSTLDRLELELPADAELPPFWGVEARRDGDLLQASRLSPVPHR